MKEVVISLRPARPSDANALAMVHEVSWREAYRGIIPGAALERVVAYRSPQWWGRFIKRTKSLIVLDLGDRIAGYVNYGANRSFYLPQKGEIYELHLDPVYQGIGLGTQLFAMARHELAQQRRKGLIAWVLQDNDRAAKFYERLGGRPYVSGYISIGDISLGRTAFLFP